MRDKQMLKGRPSPVLACRLIDMGTNLRGETKMAVLSGDLYGLQALGQVNATSSNEDGVMGRSSAPGMSGVSGFSEVGNGIYGSSSAPEGSGVWGVNIAGVGVKGQAKEGVGVVGESADNHGVQGRTSAFAHCGVYGENFFEFPPNVAGGSVNPFAGVAGRAKQGVGVVGESATGFGVRGVSKDNIGISGEGGTYGAEFFGHLAQMRLRPSPTRGEPVSGSHEMGELYLDHDGDLFLCKKSGTPGVWKRMG